MKIAVLGSTGYLGQKIVRRLLEEGGHEICCVYRESADLTIYTDAKERLCFCKSDYQSLKDYLCKGDPVDCIVNTSCSYMRGGASPEEITESNLIFPLRALNQALENPNRKKPLRYVSMGTGLPDNFNIYTFTKGELNQFGKFYAESQKVQFINMELQNFYGPSEPENRFLPDCIHKLKRNQPVLLTSGEQLRDFVFVEDVLDAVMLVIHHEELPGYLDLPIGTGEAPSIREMVQYLKKLLGSESQLQFGAVPSRPNEPSTWADLSVYHMLGGSIKYPWKQGLKHLLEIDDHENSH